MVFWDNSGGSMDGNGMREEGGRVGEPPATS